METLEDHRDVPMNSLVMYHTNLYIVSQKGAGHEPVNDAAKNMGRDTRGESIGWFGPARQSFVGLLVEVSCDNPGNSTHACDPVLYFFVYLRIELVPVWV